MFCSYLVPIAYKKIVRKSSTLNVVSDFIITRLKHPQHFAKLETKERDTLNEIQKKGYTIIPNFLDKELCNECIKDIDSMIENEKEYVQEKSDSRIFGAEKISENILRFGSDAFLHNIANHYNTADTCNAFTLANMIKFSELSSKLGSGGGWHRDSCDRQVKAIVYLNDVNKNNGAYQIIKNSHKLIQTLKDMHSGKLTYRQTRFTDEQIDQILKDEPDRLQTITGKKGTLILKDCSAIHRGSPLKSGIRYALTNYYFPRARINRQLIDHFEIKIFPEKVLAMRKN